MSLFLACLNYFLFFRSHHGVATIGDSVYAVGGWGGKRLLNSVEKYNINTNTWSKVPSISEPGYFIMVALKCNLSKEIVF